VRFFRTSSLKADHDGLQKNFRHTEEKPLQSRLHTTQKKLITLVQEKAAFVDEKGRERKERESDGFWAGDFPHSRHSLRMKARALHKR